jgi:CubicO group peptidase (beta-lactamase class C family)
MTEVGQVAFDRMVRQLAAQPHRYGGKDQLCYHSSTWGHVLGEVIRRVDGRDPDVYFREGFSGPAHADFHMRLASRADMPRVAEVILPVLPSQEEIRENNPAITDDALQIIAENKLLFAGDMREWSRISALNPSSGGASNARSIARLCAILANDGVLDSRRYLTSSIVDEASREQAAGEDPYLGPIRWGLGMALDHSHFPAPSPTSLHWGGLGGSWAVADSASRVTLGYAPNNFIIGPDMDPRHARLNTSLASVIESLGA